MGTDHLGSTIRVANSSFAAIDGMRYRPFGVSRDAGTNLQTDHKFTSQIEDQVIGLYWYTSRAYDPALGRFVAPDTIVPEPQNPQALNRYSYGHNNPLRNVDPSGHAAEDLQHLEPSWYDQAWHDEFVNNNNREPEAVDYVYRFVSMGVANSYAGEDIMRPVTIAIGAGLSPSGPGLWSLPVDQTSAGQERAEWDQRKAMGSYLEYPSPYDLDERYFGANFTEYRWGKIRIIMGAGGSRGGLVRLLGGGQDNATTFSANLIVFAGTPDVSRFEGRWWLLHELRHVMQAQALGVNYLPLYIQLWRPWPLQSHDDHPMERDAISFADRTAM